MMDVTRPVAIRPVSLQYAEGAGDDAAALLEVDALQLELEAVKCMRCFGYREHVPTCSIGRVLADAGINPMMEAA